VLLDVVAMDDFPKLRRAEDAEAKIEDARAVGRAVVLGSPTTAPLSLGAYSGVL
jgi:hypothetical protein